MNEQAHSPYYPREGNSVRPAVYAPINPCAACGGAVTSKEWRLAYGVDHRPLHVECASSVGNPDAVIDLFDEIAREVRR